VVDPRTVASLLRARIDREPLWIETSGESMGASIPAGARVLIERVSRSPRLGEVWAFAEADGTIVAHRFAGTTKTGLVFAGDGNRHRDGPVSTEHLIGRVRELDVDGRRRPIRRWPTVVMIVRRTGSGARGIARRLATRRTPL